MKKSSFPKVRQTTLATLGLGAALSIGGIGEAVHDVHFLIRKDLDAVRVVKQEEGKRAEVVAKVDDGFAANSIFKLSRVMPDSLVSRQIALFDDHWLPAETGQPAPTGQPGIFRREMGKIHDVIQKQFFANAVPFGDIIHEKARKYDVDPALVAAVIETESRFHPQARSRVGARGLMQLMPKTGRWMGARNLNDPDQNIDAGVKYLKYLQGRFDGNLSKAIAAYNAGEGNVRRYNGVPPFRETRSYVKKVMTRKKKYDAPLPSAPESGAPEGVMTLR
ncbi:MAG TPA: lytic transglycosylase domain-containing protein [Thermoanaerobaculia bacterium]|nr:lytic transglycosylase domain-containing protein [Thermoanaerobaculia bacterium]